MHRGRVDERRHIGELDFRVPASSLASRVSFTSPEVPVVDCDHHVLLVIARDGLWCGVYKLAAPQHRGQRESNRSLRSWG